MSQSTMEDFGDGYMLWHCMKNRFKFKANETFKASCLHYTLLETFILCIFFADIFRPSKSIRKATYSGCKQSDLDIGEVYQL